MGRISECTTQSGTHLSTSRIRRILRPLRTKCEKLASTSPAASAGVRVTYSSRARSNSTVNNTHSDETPPLSLLQPPESFRSKVQLDRKYIELSRNIYAVRDSFKNVVQVAFGDDRRTSVLPAPQKTNVLSLSALCCVVVGRELATDRDTTGEKDEEDSDEEAAEETSSWMDELYDAVPFHIRKWVSLICSASRLTCR